MVTGGPLSKKVWNETDQAFHLELNDDGSKEFDRWLKEEQNPFSLLSKSYKNIYKLALTNFTKYELEQAGTIALWRTLLIYNPEKYQLSTRLTYEVLGQITKLFKEYDIKFAAKTIKKDIKWDRLGTKTGCLIRANGSSEKSPDIICSEAEEYNNLHEVIDGLLPYEQDLIKGKFYENKTFNELSEGTGLVSESISNRTKKVLKKIYHKIKK